jgi:hypothetical protein
VIEDAAEAVLHPAEATGIEVAEEEVAEEMALHLAEAKASLCL